MSITIDKICLFQKEGNAGALETNRSNISQNSEYFCLISLILSTYKNFKETLTNIFTKIFSSYNFIRLFC